MDNRKYIGMDVHQASISIAVSDAAGKVLMECIIETKAATVLRLQFCTWSVPPFAAQVPSHMRRDLSTRRNPRCAFGDGWMPPKLPQYSSRHRQSGRRARLALLGFELAGRLLRHAAAQ